MDKAIQIVVLVAVIVVTAPIVLTFLQNLTTAFAGTVIGSLFSYTLVTILYGVGIFLYVKSALMPSKKY